MRKKQNLDSKNHVKSNVSKYFKKFLIGTTTLLMVACGSGDNYKNKEELKSLGLKQLGSHSFVTKNGNGRRQKLDTVTISSDKSFSILISSLRKSIRDRLKNEHGISIQEGEPGNIIATDTNGNEVKYFISKEGLVFIQGDIQQAEDILYKMLEARQSFTPLKFHEQVEDK